MNSRNKYRVNGDCRYCIVLSPAIAGYRESGVKR